MAEQIPTALQEEFSLDFFDLFLKNNWDVNDRQYRELLVSCFGKHGKFPFATNFPNTPKGLKDKEEWRSNFDKQTYLRRPFNSKNSNSTPLNSLNSGRSLLTNCS